LGCYELSLRKLKRTGVYLYIDKIFWGNVEVTEFVRDLFLNEVNRLIKESLSFVNRDSTFYYDNISFDEDSVIIRGHYINNE
jgi:hypothetical protein